MDVTKDLVVMTVDVTIIMDVEVFSGLSFSYACVETEMVSVVPAVILIAETVMDADVTASSLSYLSYAAVAEDLSAKYHMPMKEYEIGSHQEPISYCKNE